MFEQITEFGYKRDLAQVVGFYIAYLVMGILAIFIVGALYVLIIPSTTFETGVRLGTFAAIIICIVLSILIIQKKKLMSNLGYILLALIAGILAFIGGMLLGLIPVAYLTTLDSASRKRKG
jgi:hypothetical protein